MPNFEFPKLGIMPKLGMKPNLGNLKLGILNMTLNIYEVYLPNRGALRGLPVPPKGINNASLEEPPLPETQWVSAGSTDSVHSECFDLFSV